MILQLHHIYRMATKASERLAGLDLPRARRFALQHVSNTWAPMWAPRHRTKAPLPPIAEPRRLSLEDQWDRLSNVIAGASASAAEADRCQQSAGLQLDLAQYGLKMLVEELSSVMTIPGRRPASTIHIFESSPGNRYGAAIAA